MRAHGGLPVFWRSAPPSGPATAPALYLHGVPTNSDDWVPFLERSGGLGPRPARLRALGQARISEVHDRRVRTASSSASSTCSKSSACGCSFTTGARWVSHSPRPPASEWSDSSSPTPCTFLPGYRWHRTARMWRTPVLGELAMGATTRCGHCELLDARGERHPRAAAGGVDRLGARPLRPGHPACDPAPVSQLAERGAGRRPASTSRAGHAIARAVGHARTPTSPSASRASTRARCRTASWSSCPTPATGGGWTALTRSSAWRTS